MPVRYKILRMLFFPLLAALLTQTASALLIGTSSHYDGYTIFDGTLSNTKHATVAIEFAVYTRQSGEFENTFSSMGLSAPGTGDFIYAYKLFNNNASEDSISYFGILGLDEHASGITGCGALDDGKGGEQPYSSGFNDTGGFWQWSGTDAGFNLIQLGDQSWLLVYSSPYDWVKGDYELRGTEATDNVPKPPDGEVPEPTVIALLGAGAAYLFKRKRRKLT
jgi:hypothetical protein